MKQKIFLGGGTVSARERTGRKKRMQQNLLLGFQVFSFSMKVKKFLLIYPMQMNSVSIVKRLVMVERLHNT